MKKTALHLNEHFHLPPVLDMKFKSDRRSRFFIFWQN